MDGTQLLFLLLFGNVCKWEHGFGGGLGVYGSLRALGFADIPNLFLLLCCCVWCIFLFWKKNRIGLSRLTVCVIGHSFFDYTYCFLRESGIVLLL